jgi:hypothetical protein
MAWSSDQLERIGRSEEVRISSYRGDGTLRRWTPIWVVRVGDELYIRSVLGPEGGWYRNAMRRHAARIRAGGVEADVTLVATDGADTNARVDAAYEAKYSGEPDALRPMITSPATETTVRIDTLA